MAVDTVMTIICGEVDSAAKATAEQLLLFASLTASASVFCLGYEQLSDAEGPSGALQMVVGTENVIGCINLSVE